MAEILDHRRCQCGRGSFRFKLLGRSDDMIVVKGLNIYPDSIGNVVLEFSDVVTGEYQIIVAQRQPIEEILVRVEHRKGIDENDRKNIRLSIEKRVKEKTGIRTEVELVSEGVLPRTEGKAKRLVWTQCDA
jgi:phenylacetate-CoA ligase